MRILLITPAIEEPHRSEGLCLNSHYPIGLASVQATLEKHGHATRLLFLNDFPYDKCALSVAHFIACFQPDAVLVQMFSHNRVMGYAVIDFVRKTYPGIKIVVGGIHATVMAEQLVKAFPEISVVRGEAEACIDAVLESPPGIYDGPTIEVLDSLPMIDHRQFKNPKRNTYSILTSRGCPNRCSFCVLDTVSKRKVRYRSVEGVLDEMEYLEKELDAKGCWIHDDSFTLDNARAIEICRGIIKRKIKMEFVCSGRVKPMSPELVGALEAAGFSMVLFGMESGSPAILESCHKGITQEDIIKNVTMFKDSPIRTVYFLMVGLPGETVETVRETTRFVMNLQKIRHIPFGDIGVTMVYPGTEVYEIAKQKGIISDDFWMTEKPVPYYTGDHSVETLMTLKAAMLNMIRTE